MIQEHQLRQIVSIILESFLNHMPSDDLIELKGEIDQELISRAGYSAGRAAASWIEIRSDEEARHLLNGIMDGDPEVLDNLPSPDFSGEWADSQKWSDAWAEALGIDAEWAMHNHETEWLYDRYNEKFSEGVSDEIIKTAQGYGLK